MAVTLRNVGTSSATNGSAPTPGLPAGLAAGDVMICVFFSREVTDGTVSISAGWTQIINDRTSGGLLAMWWRAWQSGDAAPTLTLGGHATGNSGDSAISQIAAFTGLNTVDPVDVTGTISTNASQANIGAISGVSAGADDLVIVVGGKCDDWTSVATLSGDGLTWDELGEPDTTSGADAGLVWDYAIAGSSGTTITAKTFTVTGGANAAGKGVIVTFNALVSYTLTAEQGSFSLSGQTAGVKSTRLLTAGQGSFSLSGQSAVLSRGRSMPAETGLFTLDGQDAGFKRGYLLSAQQGSFSLSGQNVNFLRGLRLTADVGTYSFTGQSAGLLKGSVLSVAHGTFILAGQEAILDYGQNTGYTLLAETGVFSLSGQNAGSLRGYRLPADYGSIVLTGPDASVRVDYKIGCDYAQFVLVGQAADLTQGTSGTHYVLVAEYGDYRVRRQPAALYESRELPVDNIWTVDLPQIPTRKIATRRVTSGNIE